MDWISHWAAGSPSFIFRDTFGRDMDAESLGKARFIIAGAFSDAASARAFVEEFGGALCEASI